MRDLLIRYLLGELDEPSSVSSKQRLQQSPELRRELEPICEAASRRRCASEPNRRRTAAGLAQRRPRRSTTCRTNAPAPLRSTFSTIEPPTSPTSWSLADISVAAGVFLAVSMLLLPAIRGSRDSSRASSARTICDKFLGSYLVAYADDHNGYLPQVRLKSAPASSPSAWSAKATSPRTS